MSLDAVLSRIDDDLPRSQERLMDFVRIPSISTDPAHGADCVRRTGRSPAKRQPRALAE